jgi:hypothetical protein
MHIAERILIGYEIPDDHPDLVNLTRRQRDKYWKDKVDK